MGNFSSLRSRSVNFYLYVLFVRTCEVKIQNVALLFVQTFQLWYSSKKLKKGKNIPVVVKRPFTLGLAQAIKKVYQHIINTVLAGSLLANPAACFDSKRQTTIGFTHLCGVCSEKFNHGVNIEGHRHLVSQNSFKESRRLILTFEMLIRECNYANRERDKTDLQCQLICEEKRQTKGKRKQILRKNFQKSLVGLDLLVV